MAAGVNILQIAGTSVPEEFLKMLDSGRVSETECLYMANFKGIQLIRHQFLSIHWMSTESLTK